jgi:hypothetical protein
MMFTKHLEIALLTAFLALSAVAVPLTATAQDEETQPADDGKKETETGTPAATEPEPDC